MTLEELKKYKIGDRVEFYREGCENAENDWLKGAVYLIDEGFDGDENECVVLVKADKKIHSLTCLGGYGWYEIDPKNIRKIND